MSRLTVRDAAAGPRWVETRDSNVSARNAQRESWRFNAALRRARDTGLYPYCLEVVIPVAKTSRDGWPTAEEAQRLAGLEEEVIAGVGDRAVLAGVLTTIGGAHGVYRLVFYTGSPDWTAKLRSQLRAATGVGTLRVNCDPDPHWFEYRSYKRGDTASPKKVFQFLGLIIAADILWAAVNGAYGRAWGWGELAVLVLLVAARLLPRKSLGRSRTRPALRFGASAIALSAIVFPLPYLFHMPAWTALIVSLLAGPALAAGARIARLAYWRRRGAALTQTDPGSYETPAQKR